MMHYMVVKKIYSSCTIKDGEQAVSFREEDKVLLKSSRGFEAPFNRPFETLFNVVCEKKSDRVPKGIKLKGCWDSVKTRGHRLNLTIIAGGPEQVTR